MAKKTTKSSKSPKIEEEPLTILEAQNPAEPPVTVKEESKSIVSDVTTTETLPAEKKAELTEEEQAKVEEEKEKQLRLESFRKAGQIHKQVLEFISPKIQIGTKYLDICTDVEAKIFELGGEIGFPTNVCVNEVAAHYSSPPNDDSVIKEGDIVKIDVGVSVEGYVADGAFTVSFNKEKITENLVTAVQTAVLKGLSIIKPGIKTNEVGKVTSKIIKGFGYNPIKDLSGHSIEKWQVHGNGEIPNVEMPSGKEFKEGDVFALECFASTGSGNIHRSSNCYIYEYDLSSDRVPLRNKLSRKVVGWIGKVKKTLPFSSRELLKEFQAGQFALRELITAGKVYRHFVLKEDPGVYVAQWEHTFMVTAEGIEQLT